MNIIMMNNRFTCNKLMLVSELIFCNGKIILSFCWENQCCFKLASKNTSSLQHSTGSSHRVCHLGKGQSCCSEWLSGALLWVIISQMTFTAQKLSCHLSWQLQLCVDVSSVLIMIVYLLYSFCWMLICLKDLWKCVQIVCHLWTSRWHCCCVFMSAAFQCLKL